MGRKKQPHYRIVVSDSTFPRDGRFVETLGYYKPLTDPARLVLDLQRVDHWIGEGASPSDTVKSLISKARRGGDGGLAVGVEDLEERKTKRAEELAAKRAAEQRAAEIVKSKADEAAKAEAAEAAEAEAAEAAKSKAAEAAEAEAAEAAKAEAAEAAKAEAAEAAKAEAAEEAAAAKAEVGAEEAAGEAKSE
jgi:small subunit ribosomal protein S16